MTTRPKLRLGTRGSPLALAQTDAVRTLIAAAHPELAAPGAIGIVLIRTTGDRIQDRPLAEIGGKGLFTKEIDESLLGGEIDMAVHSVKDLYTLMPKGVILPCMIAREDPRDAFFSPRASSLAELPKGAVVGTASLRRQAQILARYPHLRTRILRGNVQTRLQKLAEGDVDATLLALAGLKRLKMENCATALLSVEEMLPAVGQGAIGVTCRENDAEAKRLLAPLNDATTMACVACERAFLAMLDGSCRTPIAGLATIEANGHGPILRFRGLIARPDGTDMLRVECRGEVAEAEAIGRQAALDLLARGAERVLAVAEVRV